MVIDQDTKKDVERLEKDLQIEIDETQEQISNASVDDLYEPDQEEVKKTIENPNINKVLTQHGEFPDPKSSLSEEKRNEVDEKLSTKSNVEIDEDIQKKVEKDRQEREILIMELAARPSMTMHLYSGMNEETGETVWVQKSFFFNNPTKQQNQWLKQMLNKTSDMEFRYNELIRKPYSQLSQEEWLFLRKARLYIDAVRYNLQKREMKYRFNMSPQDFERLSDADHALALEVTVYRTNTAGPYPRAGR